MSEPVDPGRGAGDEAIDACKSSHIPGLRPSGSVRDRVSNESKESIEQSGKGG